MTSTTLLLLAGIGAGLASTELPDRSPAPRGVSSAVTVSAPPPALVAEAVAPAAAGAGPGAVQAIALPPPMCVLCWL